MSTKIQFKIHNSRKDDSKITSEEVVKDRSEETQSNGSEEVQTGGLSIIVLLFIIANAIFLTFWLFNAVGDLTERQGFYKARIQAAKHVDLINQISLAIDVHNVDNEEKVIDLKLLVSRQYLQAFRQFRPLPKSVITVSHPCSYLERYSFGVNAKRKL